MKLSSMADREDKPPKPGSSSSRKAETAFDVWLRRGLHQLFDEVTREPIPPEILRMLEDDSNKDPT